MDDISDSAYTHYTVPPDVVRAAIARAVVGARTATTRDNVMLGSITLLPHQRDAVARIRLALADLGVALLADDVGLGKTFVALALAREYQSVRIIAPAALLPMWRTAIARAQGRVEQLVSLQRFSRSQPPLRPSPSRGTAASASVAASVSASVSASASASASTAPPRALVIIDEAHHVRTPSTKRYRAVAEYVAGSDVLLMSATPVHNASDDLRALLALALGVRAQRLTPALLARVVVRRTHEGARPQLCEQPPIRLRHDASLLDAILALPAPLPARDGAVAGALVRLGLLRAWCSSNAALAATLQRRLLRGEALRQALLAGRHPSGAELRSWLVGEHEVQLAFPELLAPETPDSESLLDVLERHLEAVRDVAASVRSDPSADTARANALRDIIRAHPETPVVAFSQYAETVRCVGRALSDIAGVGVLTGPRAWIASGRISRQEALEAFAPDAHGRPPPPPHQRIRLLITTDLLAEGVNLQDAGVVVHLDLPWTDALRRQRVGRCLRVGSPHARVVVYRVEPPVGAEAALRLYARLRRKAACADRLVGRADATSRHTTSHREVSHREVSHREVSHRAVSHRAVSRHVATRMSAADCASALRAILLQWESDDARPLPISDYAPPHAPIVSSHSCGTVGFLALVRLADDRVTLVGGRRVRGPAGRTVVRLSASPRRLLPLLRAAMHPAAMRPAAMHPAAMRPAAMRPAAMRPAAMRPSSHRSSAASGSSLSWSRIHRALHRWMHRERLHRDTGIGTDAESSVQQEARRRVTEAVARCPPLQRVGVRDAVRRTLAMIVRIRGRAAEGALREWMSARERHPLPEWLAGWLAVPLLAAEWGDAPEAADADGATCLATSVATSLATSFATSFATSVAADGRTGLGATEAILRLYKADGRMQAASLQTCHDSPSSSTSTAR